MHRVATLPPIADMSSVVSHATSSPGFGARGLDAGHRAPVLTGHALVQPSPQDRDFIALQNAYRPYGGLSRVQRLAGGDLVRFEGLECDIADLVEAGLLFGFQWHDAMWIPMFQIDLPGGSIAIRPQRVVAELGCGFDGWALASWFARPNSSLANHSPIECLAARLPEVLEVARMDRFVVTG